MTTKMKTFLYARVSSTKQDTHSQLPQLRNWAEQNEPDATLVEDVGTGKNMKRDGIKSIIAEIEKGRVAKVVVVSINRLGRNTTQVCQFLDLCMKNEVNVVTLREGFDLSTPMGRAMAKMMAVLAELENEQRSEATLAGLDAAREKALAEGHEFKTGGSRKGWSAKVTREKHDTILKLRDDAWSYRAIARATGLSDKTVRHVCLSPRKKILTRSQLSLEN